MTIKKTIIPFLTWPGGKRWLVHGDEEITPPKYKRYIEPFVGSGAVFFSKNSSEYIITDLNPDLINCYETIKKNWKGVLDHLRVHHKNHSKDYYYKMRASQPRMAETKAARFIYLNRTCWNGLYRVNLRGQFNVAMGTKKNVVLETDNFEETARKLEHGQILCQDFEKTLDMASKGDFIFIDPPYTVKHNMNGFINYTEKIFSWDDQVRLKNAMQKAVSRGVMITMTNADHDSIHDLYGDLGTINKISRNSIIAASSKHRGKYSEVLLRVGWAPTE